MIETLCKLWALAGISRPADSNWNSYFEPIGLILQGKLEREDYWCTPKNSITFASTGGDGVHYGLLDIGNGFAETSPIVMTVPMCETPNTVVGANLLEFLSLGCRQGYFILEQLTYELDEMIATLDSGKFNDEAGEDEKALLKTIVNEFALAPWDDHHTRLQELHIEYFQFIDADDEPAT